MIFVALLEVAPAKSPASTSTVFRPRSWASSAHPAPADYANVERLAFDIAQHFFTVFHGIPCAELMNCIRGSSATLLCCWNTDAVWTGDGYIRITFSQNKFAGLYCDALDT